MDARLSEPYAVFADDSEYGQQIGEAKELSNPLADVEQLHLAACAASRGIEAHDGAESHAVHVAEIAEIEDDSLVLRNQRLTRWRGFRLVRIPVVRDIARWRVRRMRSISRVR